MQDETRLIHVLWHRCVVQEEQNAPQLRDDAVFTHEHRNQGLATPFARAQALLTLPGENSALIAFL